MPTDAFRLQLQPVTDFVAGRPLDRELAEALTQRFPPDGQFFTAVESACHQAIAEGWMCAQGSAGRRFGRVVEPSEVSCGFSIDVVALADIAGPLHRHPLGEICMVMPVTAGARFDGQPRGWRVYGPGSAHRPTVTGGEALVLYLLPDGQIEFTGQ